MTTPARGRSECPLGTRPGRPLSALGQTHGFCTRRDLCSERILLVPEGAEESEKMQEGAGRRTVRLRTRSLTRCAVRCSSVPFPRVMTTSFLAQERSACDSSHWGRRKPIRRQACGGVPVAGAEGRQRWRVPEPHGQHTGQTRPLTLEKTTGDQHNSSGGG